MDARSLEKKARLEEALEKGVVMLHLDPRRPGVIVPTAFRADFQLRLNVSYNFSPPDLSVNDWGVRETLSFSRTPHRVAVPWSAIFAITTGESPGQAWLFPEDMPPELIEAAASRWGLSGDEVAQLKREAQETVSLAVERPESPPERVRGFKPRVVGAEPLEDEEAGLRAAPEPVEDSRDDAESQVPAAAKAPAPSLAPVPALASVPAPAPADEAQEADGEPTPEPVRRGHLRIIK